LTLQNICKHKYEIKFSLRFFLNNSSITISGSTATSRLCVKKVNPSDGFAQARIQLGTSGGAKSFLRGVQIFKLCPIRPVTSLGHQGCEEFYERAQTFQTMTSSFQLCPTDFSRGCEKVCRGGFAPFTRGYGPVSNSFKVCPTHFAGGSKFFLASYGPGFAPYCCVDRLATVEALKMNAHLLLLLLATLQISGIECECLRKRHNWSLSIRFNSQLRVWVTGSRAMRGGLQVHCSGARQLRRGLKQKDRPVTSLRHQGVKSFLRGAQFF